MKLSRWGEPNVVHLHSDLFLQHLLMKCPQWAAGDWVIKHSQAPHEFRHLFHTEAAAKEFGQRWHPSNGSFLHSPACRGLKNESAFSRWPWRRRSKIAHVGRHGYNEECLFEVLFTHLKKKWTNKQSLSDACRGLSKEWNRLQSDEIQWNWLKKWHETTQHDDTKEGIGSMSFHQQEVQVEPGARPRSQCETLNPNLRPEVEIKERKQ